MHSFTVRRAPAVVAYALFGYRVLVELYREQLSLSGFAIELVMFLPVAAYLGWVY